MSTIAGLSSLLPLPVAIPLAGATLSPLAARIDRRAPLVVGLLGLLGAAGVLLGVAPRVFGGEVISHYMGGWVPVGGRSLGIAFAADPFGLAYALVAAGVGAVLLVATISELGDLGPREIGGYACLFQLLVAALIGTALTADLFNLFVWFEVAALASYGLTGFFLERPIALEAAFKVLTLTTLASFAIFVAATLLYANHGALNFAQLHAAVSGHPHTADMVALGLLICGFATKAGLIPFHGWLPDAHTAAPGPVSALFSGLMVSLGVVAIARIALQIYGPVGGRPVVGLLMAIGVASALAGAVLALAQDNLKRLLAYDTISQMGVLVVGFATAVPAGVAGATYHLIDHALYKSLLFLAAGSILHATGHEKLSELGGLARRRPVPAIAFMAGVAAIAGIPPLNGYPSLGLIHEGLTGSGRPGVNLAMLVAQVITVAALGRAAYLAFFRRREEPYEDLQPDRPGMIFAFVALGAACLAAGVFPNWILDQVAAPAAASLLHGGTYASGVLTGHVVLPHLGVSFDYFRPGELLTVAATILAGILLAAGYLRVAEP
ncbi:MAG: Fe-S-binding domain-containing protein, partial [Actinobacteria bacterium]|nr:Fe-S-binding domain-containing protein [Actinomycetota bacterium]